MIYPRGFAAGAIAGQKGFQATDQARKNRVGFLGFGNGAVDLRRRSARLERLNAMADGIAGFARDQRDIIGQSFTAPGGIDHGNVQLAGVAFKDRGIAATGEDERAIERDGLIERGGAVLVAFAPVPDSADCTARDRARGFPANAADDRSDSEGEGEGRANLGHCEGPFRCAFRF